MNEYLSIDYFNIDSLFFKIRIMIRDTARQFVTKTTNTIKKIKWVLKLPSGNKRKMEIPCFSDTNLPSKYNNYVFQNNSLVKIFQPETGRQVVLSIVSSGGLINKIELRYNSHLCLEMIFY